MTTTQLPPRRARNIIWLLAASVALMMTGFGITIPVFARRLGKLGSGVEALGLMTMVFALTQLIAAPLLGSWTDKWGRRPFFQSPPPVTTQPIINQRPHRQRPN